MRIIYKSEAREQVGVKLDGAEVSSIVYHDIFNYPLTLAELIKWRAGDDEAGADREHEVVFRKGFYYLQGRESFVISRLMRQRASKRKLPIAIRAAEVLAHLPSVKMVAITGALAMQNADELSDIDLLVIVSKKTLWATRLVSLVILKLFKVKVRRYADKNERDKICLNMWLDERDLTWRKRNPYSAHELSQMRPLVNKDASYEDLMMKNEWVEKYWPNAVRIGSKEHVVRSKGKKGGAEIG